MEPWPRDARGWGRVVLLLVSIVVVVGAIVAWMTAMPGRSWGGPPPPLRPEEQELRRRLERHVRVLATEIGERHLYRPARLEEAAAYAEACLREAGYETVSQQFEVDGVSVRNVETLRTGTARPGETVVVGAHYDSVDGSPGADDNATGVAALLEIARLLQNAAPSRTVRFVLFVNEEPPFFQTEAMGSLHWARRARQRRERVVAMLSLESLGYYSDANGSQLYPFPLGLLYPSRGDFVGFVGDLGARGLVRKAIGCFRRHAVVPSEGVAAPSAIPGIAWSDHWAFRRQGFPAIMVTDTALFRHPAYHAAADSPEKLDYDRFARVVAALARTVIDLAAP